MYWSTVIIEHKQFVLAQCRSLQMMWDNWCKKGGCGGVCKSCSWIPMQWGQKTVKCSDWILIIFLRLNQRSHFCDMDKSWEVKILSHVCCSPTCHQPDRQGGRLQVQHQSFSDNAEFSQMSSDNVSLFSSGAPSSVCSSLEPGHGQTPRPLEEITYSLQVKRQPIESVMIYQYLQCRFQRVKKTKIVCWPVTNTPGIKKWVGTRGGGGGDLEGHRLPYHGTFHGIPNPGSTTFKHESVLFHCNCCVVCRYEMLKLTA